MKTKILTIALAALSIGLLGSCKKEDPKVSVTGVTLDKTTLEITVGDPDVKLVATVTPDNATDNTVNWASDKAEVATVDNQGSVHAIAPGEATITVTTTDGGKTATCAVTVKAALPAGALAGEFSVAEGKKVHFSKGNLVATINDSGTPTAWKFATNQYDYLGEGGANKTIDQAAGDIDLFGWSTASTTYGISTSTSPSSYSGDFVDWGKNIGDGNTWRTLSKDEWTYLFNTRTASTVSGTENARYAKATVNDIKGIILLPDTYTHPEGVTALASINTADAAFTANTYDSANWAKIESAGAVFFPAAGYRLGSDVTNGGVRGYYWSSTAYDGYGGYDANDVIFNSDNVNPATNGSRSLGFSVRLITDVQ